jgi:hypothetical protein
MVILWYICWIKLLSFKIFLWCVSPLRIGDLNKSVFGSKWIRILPIFAWEYCWPLTLGVICRCLDIFNPAEKMILKKYRKDNFAPKVLNYDERRAIGKCPLTPEEVIFFLVIILISCFLKFPVQSSSRLRRLIHWLVQDWLWTSVWCLVIFS